MPRFKDVELNRHGLNPMQIKAINYKMRGWSERDAMKKAGYSKGMYEKDRYSVFGHPNVKAEIERRKQRLAESNQVTEEWIVQRLMKIAGADPGDMIEVDEDTGEAHINWNKLTPSMRAAVAGLEETKFMQGRGENAVPATKVKVTPRDTLRAIEMLGKYLGMFKEKVEVSTDNDLVKRLQAGRARVGQEEGDDG